MYGHQVESSKTINRSTEANDLYRILAVYFPQTSGDESEHRIHLASSLLHFFFSPQGQKILSQVKEEDGSFFLPLDFQHFKKACDIEEFYIALVEKPKEALLCMSAAAHKVYFGKEDLMEECAKITIRLHNYQESMIALKNLKAAYIDRLVSVRGTVVKVSTVRPLVIQMCFSCAKCGTTMTCDFPDGKFSPPTKCEMQACKSRNFNPVRSTALPIDFQKIRIQELLKSEHHEEGRVPRTVECELTQDLVDACIPGDIVTVTGIIRVINNYMDIGGGKSKGKNQTLYYLYLEVVSITNSKSQSSLRMHKIRISILGPQSI